jgi:hypothetical protein
MSSSQLIRSAPLLLLAVLFVLTDCVTGQQTKIASTSSAEIEGLVDQLRLYPWEGHRNFTSPIHWVFNFTDPMRKILETGSAAQEILLRHLNDEGTKDQIIALLGGVGDARSIEPIIHAMADEEEQRADPAAKKMNLVANITLTNITAAEVIWHRGGGIPFAKCPNDPKACWSAWWNQNKDHIEKEMDVSRNYSNYPNYGIYKLRKDY